MTKLTSGAIKDYYSKEVKNYEPILQVLEIFEIKTRPDIKKVYLSDGEFIIWGYLENRPELVEKIFIQVKTVIVQSTPKGQLVLKMEKSGEYDILPVTDANDNFVGNPVSYLKNDIDWELPVPKKHRDSTLRHLRDYESRSTLAVAAKNLKASSSQLFLFKVTKIDKPRPYKNAKGSGVILNVEFADTNGESAKGTMFKQEYIDKFNFLREGKLFYVSGIKLAVPKPSQWVSTSYEFSIGDSTSILYFVPSSFDKDKETTKTILSEFKTNLPSFKFTPLQELPKCSPKVDVDIIGVVHEVSDIINSTTAKGESLNRRVISVVTPMDQEFKDTKDVKNVKDGKDSSSSSSKTTKRRASSDDDDSDEDSDNEENSGKIPPSGYTVDFTLFRKDAEDPQYSSKLVGKVIALKKCNVSAFKGKIGVGGFQFSKFINPEIPETAQLANWYAGILQITAPLKFKSIDASDEILNTLLLSSKQITCQELKELKNKDKDVKDESDSSKSKKSHSGNVRAQIIEFKIENEDPWYNACVNCNRKVMEKEGRTYCGGCVDFVSEVRPKFALNLVIADSTSSIPCRVYDSFAEKILGIDVDSLKSLNKLSQDRYREIFSSKILKNYYIFQVEVKTSTAINNQSSKDDNDSEKKMIPLVTFDNYTIHQVAVVDIEAELKANKK